MAAEKLPAGGRPQTRGEAMDQFLRDQGLSEQDVAQASACIGDFFVDAWKVLPFPPLLGISARKAGDGTRSGTLAGGAPVLPARGV